MSGFTTATPPIAAFGSGYNVLRRVANATRSSCRRRRPIAQQSQNHAHRCARIFDGYAESQTFPVAAAAGCDRARSGRKIKRLGVPAFTTAPPPIAAFGSGYKVPRRVAGVTRSNRKIRHLDAPDFMNLERHADLQKTLCPWEYGPRPWAHSAPGPPSFPDTNSNASPLG